MNISEEVKKLLNQEKLCTLATCMDNKPYLSLMSFTYVPEENRIILSSRRNSKKYRNILINKNISVLLFSKEPEISATFLGTASLIEGKKESYYREMHLNNNSMPQFILGDDIGLIIFDIEKIVISNRQDEVKYISEETTE